MAAPRGVRLPFVRQLHRSGKYWEHEFAHLQLAPKYHRLSMIIRLACSGHPECSLASLIIASALLGYDWLFQGGRFEASNGETGPCTSIFFIRKSFLTV